MTKNIFDLNSKNVLIIDYLEDTDINFEMIIEISKENGYKINKKEIFKKEEVEKYNTFIGKNYIAILFEKKQK